MRPRAPPRRGTRFAPFPRLHPVDRRTLRGGESEENRKAAGAVPPARHRGACRVRARRHRDGCEPAASAIAIAVAIAAAAGCAAAVAIAVPVAIETPRSHEPHEPDPGGAGPGRAAHPALAFRVAESGKGDARPLR